MKRFRTRSIRTNLVLLVLLVLLPLFTILVYSSLKQKEQAIKYANQSVVSIANNLAFQLKLIENNFRQTLSIISLIPEIKNAEPEKTSILLNQLIKQNPSFASLLLVDTNGDLIASGMGTSPINVSDRKYFKDVRKNKTFSVGEYTRGRLSHKLVIHFAYPILNTDQTLKSVIIASFDLKYYDKVFNTFELGKNAILTFVDHSGTVLYNSPNSISRPGIKLQKNLNKYFQQNITNISFETKGNDSVARIYAMSYLNLPENKPYLTIFVGLPKDVAVSDFYKTLTKYAFFWVFAGIMIIILAYMFAVKAIVRPLEKLVKSAGSIAEGNLQIQISKPSSSSEIGKLFVAINEMTKKLQQRETERNMALKDLKKLKERFELAVNSANIGIWDWHIRNNKLIWDKNMFSLYNADSNSFNYQMNYWKDLIHPKDIDKFELLLNQAIENNEPFRSEFRIKLPNKTTKHIRIYGNVILDKESKPVRLIGVNWDITERKNLERKLNDAREKAETSDKLKSTFLANISHEFRTPLHGIIGFAQILKTNEISTPEKIQYLDIIIQSGNKLQNIISNIIDISLLEANQLKLGENECDVHILFDEIYNKYIDIKIGEHKLFNFILEEPSDKISKVVLDEYRIKQILTNLLDNAFKFTETGEIRFGFNYCENNIVFHIKDTGIGINKENTEVIFDRFKQVEQGLDRNYSGNGLGLTICKGLVELMGGRIWLECKTKGSDFYFSIPVMEKESVNDGVKNKSDFFLN